MDRLARSLVMSLGLMVVGADAQQSPKAVPLWPGAAPGAQGTADAEVPTMTAYLPKANPTRTAVVVAPGGGYLHLSAAHEGTDYAEWLNAHGIAAFVLKYRLGPTYHYPVQLEDAQRAIRTVRARAAEYGVAPDHVGVWGSSAGGHLAATAGTHFDGGRADSADGIERQGSRPDFLILAYPVITMEDPEVHKGSRDALLGDQPSAELLRELSAEKQVNGSTPPTFLFATTDDEVVPVMNSVMFYSALVRAGVPTEMHLFQHGGHGAGLAVGNGDLSVWPDLLLKWMQARGLAAK